MSNCRRYWLSTDKRPHTQKNSHAPQPRNQTKLERSGGDASARSMYGARVAGRARTVPATPARGTLDRPAYTANENDTAATHPEKLLCTPHGLGLTRGAARPCVNTRPLFPMEHVLGGLPGGAHRGETGPVDGLNERHHRAGASR